MDSLRYAVEATIWEQKKLARWRHRDETGKKDAILILTSFI